MFPKEHVVLGAVFSLILFFLFPRIGLLGFSIVFLSAVLIDVDHYIYYVFKKRNLNLESAYNWYIKCGMKFKSLPKRERNNFHGSICFLHGTEILLVLFLASFVFQSFLFVFVGFTFHLILDVIYVTTYLDRIDRVSAIYDFFKFKKLKFIEG